LSNPNAQGDVPIVISIYKLSDLANNTALDLRYDTHSIPGYTIMLNTPANKHTALASTTYTSNTPHTHPITTAPFNSSTVNLVSLYFKLSEKLTPFPIDFLPTGHYNQASFNIIEKNHPHGFLTTKEQRFIHHFTMIYQDRFAWNETQKGLFHKDFFPPVCMPITKHVPWVLQNMLIPPGIYNTILDVICKKIAA
jgi:hypothetical protein